MIGLKFTQNAPRLRLGVEWIWNQSQLFQHYFHNYIKLHTTIHIYNPYVFFREAWLRLSMQYHPDLNPDDEKASQRFMEIKESYKGLRNSFSLESTAYK